MKLPRLEDLPDVAGRAVLVRCDLNVPLAGGAVADDTRIRAAVPTLSWLVERGARVTACSHLGRPGGRVDPRLGMGPVRARLSQLVPGVELIDNLRFDPGEEACDPAFVERLVAGQDLYVNDAFASSHRAHASIVGPPRFLPSAAGRLLAVEVEALSALLDEPARPFLVVLGGAKASDKIGVVASLLPRADTALIGGGMCFTFMAAAGRDTGDSKVELEHLARCRELLGGGRVALPSDLVVINSLNPERVRHVGADVPDGWRGVDIGSESAAMFSDLVAAAGTVLWNGPMGVFEDPRFAAGTRSVGRAVAGSAAFTVAGGGDTVAAVDRFGLRGIDHVSTGGGAMLALVERGDLPGLAALRAAAARLNPAGEGVD